MPSRKEAKSAMIIIKYTTIKNSYSAFSTASLNASLFLLEYKNTWDTLKHRYIINSEVLLPGTYRCGTAKYTNALVGYEPSYSLIMLAIGVSDPTIITVVLATQTFFPPSMALHSMVGVNCLLSSKVQHYISDVLMPQCHAHAY